MSSCPQIISTILIRILYVWHPHPHILILLQGLATIPLCNWIHLFYHFIPLPGINIVEIVLYLVMPMSWRIVSQDRFLNRLQRSSVTTSDCTHSCLVDFSIHLTTIGLQQNGLDIDVNNSTASQTLSARKQHTVAKLGYFSPEICFAASNA